MTAVPAEAEACAGGGARVVVGGVGPVAAAAATAFALAGESFDGVVCAGIGGGLPGVAVGTVAVASTAAFADLGTETADGFGALPASLARTEYPAALGAELARRTGASLGTILTVATVTGTAGTAARLQCRYPDAVAEGMEGAGVAEAAARASVPFGEVRAISNPVGPRDRSSWRLDEALSALRAAFRAIGDLS